jgi:hypothetical protein
MFCATQSIPTPTKQQVTSLTPCISTTTSSPLVKGAGITAYDGAIVTATRNTISGASGGSGFGIRDSTVIGP